MMEIQKHNENVLVIGAYFNTANHLVLKTDKEDTELLKTWSEGAFGDINVRAHVRNEKHCGSPRRRNSCHRQRGGSRDAQELIRRAKCQASQE